MASVVERNKILGTSNSVIVWHILASATQWAKQPNFSHLSLSRPDPDVGKLHELSQIQEGHT